MVPHAALVLRALLGEDETPLFVLLLKNQGLDRLTEMDDLRGVDVVANRELPYRDHTLGLEADVEQDLVAVDLDHGALDQVPVVELHDGPRHRVLERRAPEVVLGHGTGCVHTVLVEAPHCFGGEQGSAVGHGLGFGHG